MNANMKISHILYKVKNLHEAVADFEKMGFTVKYGTRKDKAFNALIWFEEGPFIELFATKEMPKIFVVLAKLMGKEAALKRFEKYSRADYGWVDYAIENERNDLDKENELLREMGYKYSTLPGKRKNIDNLKLRWKLSVPFDLNIPFLMSAYTPNPRPKSIKHANGAKSVVKLVWGIEESRKSDIERLVNDERLELITGYGFKKIEFDGWNAQILNNEEEK